LKREFTIVIVTHNMQQAARVADQTPLCISAIWSRRDRPPRCSPIPRTIARSTTSRAASA